MELPVISEREDNCRFIAYIAGALARPAGGNMRISFGGGRVSLSSCGEELRPLAEEKIAEVLCIGYKYAELASVAPAGLGAGDTEILRAAIIAADVASKAADIQIGFVDRFNGSLIITGDVAGVEAALHDVMSVLCDQMGFASAPITRS